MKMRALYDKEGNYQVTHPINSNLMCRSSEFEEAAKDFLKILRNLKKQKGGNINQREVLNRAVYTMQQLIGAALDGLEGGKSNTARKLNGDLFEHLIRLVIRELGITADAGVVQIPVMIDGIKEFSMSYQHDLIIKAEEEIKITGSVKTSGKDRIDKIFIDKFLYSRLTNTTLPHIAVFLNDVQRKVTRSENEYGINSTFLPGHFKGYTIKLNPLDGVYYCDIRPNMLTENILKDHIKTFDHFLVEDIWTLLA